MVSISVSTTGLQAYNPRARGRSTPRSLLLVSQFAPPAGFSSATRVAGLTKYLSRRGHTVAVVTSQLSGSGAVPEAAAVVRAPDLILSRLNWRRANFEAISGGGGDYGKPSRVAAWALPDIALASWVPFALGAALRLHRRRSFDAVITSSPPHSTHLIGAALQRLGVTWIADFRDGWLFEALGPDRPPGLQRAERALEAELVRRANAVTAVTAPIARDLGTRLGVQATIVPNGFDPEEPPGDADGAAHLLRADRHSLVYTGRFAHGGRSPSALLEGLRRLLQEAPAVAARLELVLAGPLTASEQQAVSAPDIAHAVRWVGTLDRSATLALQRAADSLLVLVPETRAGDATGKLYEYLAAGRPIVVLGASSDAARIVTELGVGVVARADDPRRIAGVLAQLPDWDAARLTAAPRDRFSWPLLAESMDEVIASALSAQEKRAR